MRPRNKGYGDAGASWKRRALKGFDAMSGSAQEDIDFHNFTMRQRARMLYMASPIAASAIKTNRSNVVGSGLRLKSRIDREVLGMSAEQADAWQKKTEREFRLWAGRKKACDATGINNFYGLQQLALMSWLLSGDCVGVIKQYNTDRMYPYAFRIHLVEADRVSTPVTGNSLTIISTTGKDPETGNTIYDGVEVDKNGSIVAYHIRNTYPYELGAMEKTEWVRIPAYQEQTGLPNVLHVMNTERPDQYRGVSYLAQVIEPILQIRRYTEAEIMAAIVESFFTAFVETEQPTDENPFNETGEPNISDVNEYSMGPGQINILKPGEKVSFGDPKRPSGGFDDFVKSMCTQVGAALDIPRDQLLKEFNSSYSASRAALMDAWKGFRNRREWLRDDFCQPCYEIWMSEAVARGRIYAPGFFTDPIIREAYLGSEWIGPSQGQLDPVKEITAEILACEQGFSTREQSTIRLNGGEWDRNMEQLEKENEKMSGIQKEAEPAEGVYSRTEGAAKVITRMVVEDQIRRAGGD